MTRFECDRAKARSNWDKHHIRFTDAARAIKTGYCLTARSPQSDALGEERNTSIAKRADGRAIVVVWTPRGRNARIISVRHARKKERESFDVYLKKLQ